MPRLPSISTFLLVIRILKGDILVLSLIFQEDNQ